MYFLYVSWIGLKINSYIWEHTNMFIVNAEFADQAICAYPIMNLYLISLKLSKLMVSRTF